MASLSPSFLHLLSFFLFSNPVGEALTHLSVQGPETQPPVSLLTPTCLPSVSSGPDGQFHFCASSGLRMGRDPFSAGRMIPLVTTLPTAGEQSLRLHFAGAGCEDGAGRESYPSVSGGCCSDRELSSSNRSQDNSSSGLTAELSLGYSQL